MKPEEVRLVSLLLLLTLLIGMLLGASIADRRGLVLLREDGYNLLEDTSLRRGQGRYVIQVWRDGQWVDIPR